MRLKIENCGSIDSLPEFCTPAELSMILPVSRATLYRMAEQKRIPSLRVGRRVIIPREHLKKWIEQESGIAGKAHLESENARSDRKLIKREFVLGLVEEALNEAKRLAGTGFCEAPEENPTKAIEEKPA